MTSKSTIGSNRRETITVAAAFVFLLGLIFFWTPVMAAAGFLLSIRLSLFVVDLALANPRDLHKHRAGVRYTR